MAGPVVPHFTNDIGAEVVRIGAREFMCIGASPPFDHPHEFLDMGSDQEKICPYCGTLFRYDPALAQHQSLPAECAWIPKAA